MTDLCLCTEADAVLFANDDWRVLADGLEHRGTGYFIARSALASRHRDGLWAWPLQLAEKSWCARRSFQEAFMRALGLFGIAPDEDLTRSFAIGADMRVGSSHDGFVSIGALIRPRSSERKRPASAEARIPAARRLPAHGRVAVGSTS